MSKNIHDIPYITFLDVDGSLDRAKEEVKNRSLELKSLAPVREKIKAGWDEISNKWDHANKELGYYQAVIDEIERRRHYRKITEATCLEKAFFPDEYDEKEDISPSNGSATLRTLEEAQELCKALTKDEEIHYKIEDKEWKGPGLYLICPKRWYSSGYSGWTAELVKSEGKNG